LAAHEFFSPKWSPRIREEWTRNLVARLTARDGGDVAGSKVARIAVAVETAFPDALVDTWVLMIEQPDQPRESRGTCLIAWVPPTFVSRAQHGIEANPEECVCWLDECSHDLQRVVRNALQM
jgi:hypothetical protein